MHKKNRNTQVQVVAGGGKPLAKQHAGERAGEQQRHQQQRAIQPLPTAAKTAERKAEAVGCSAARARQICQREGRELRKGVHISGVRGRRRRRQRSAPATTTSPPLAPAARAAPSRASSQTARRGCQASRRTWRRRRRRRRLWRAAARADRSRCALSITAHSRQKVAKCLGNARRFVGELSLLSLWGACQTYAHTSRLITAAGARKTIVPAGRRALRQLGRPARDGRVGCETE